MQKNGALYDFEIIRIIMLLQFFHLRAKGEKEGEGFKEERGARVIAGDEGFLNLLRIFISSNSKDFEKKIGLR